MLQAGIQRPLGAVVDALSLRPVCACGHALHPLPTRGRRGNMGAPGCGGVEDGAVLLLAGPPWHLVPRCVLEKSVRTPHVYASQAASLRVTGYSAAGDRDKVRLLPCSM